MPGNFKIIAFLLAFRPPLFQICSSPMSQAYSSSTSPATADYIVVVSSEDDFHSSFHQFADKVNRKLRAGYQLHGQPFSLNQALCQAMVRLEGAQPSGDTTVFYQRPDERRLL